MELIQGTSLLVLLLVLGVQSQLMPNQPIPCCLPDKFNVTITDLNTVNNDKIKMQFVQTDFVAKRQLIQTAIKSYESAGLSPSTTEVLDFDVGKLYTTSALDPTVCHVTNSSLKPGQCIPREQTGALLLYTNFVSSGNFLPIQVPQNCTNGSTPSGTSNHYAMHGFF